MATTLQLPLRSYQEECLKHAKEKNTIVCLDTGLGKTLIAVRLIGYYLNQYRDKRAVFLVPTQALVDQQATYCKAHIQLETSAGDARNVRVLNMVGDEQAGWSQQEWSKAIQDHDIFLGTPAVFQKAVITERYIQIEQFCVMVFDECHNARKNAPMAAIMRYAVHPYYKKHQQPSASGGGERLPRILGLTASFVSGKINKLVKDRQELEALLQSTIICPLMEKKLEDKNVVRITYGKDVYHTQKHAEAIEAQLEETLLRMARFKDIKKAVKQCSLVFSELGREALVFYVNHAIVQQIVDKIATLGRFEDENAVRAAASLRRGLPALREEVEKLSKRLLSAGIAKKQIALRTPKLQRLLDLLGENFSKNAATGYRGIIFVEQIALVPTLAKEIKDWFVDDIVDCGVVTGSSAQTASQRKENLDAFRSGETRILVATAACEEGLDVAECQFVILYSESKTTKSNIQRTGRLRHKDAELYYFENDPDSERRKAASMRAVAGDSSLALTQEELNTQNAVTDASVDNKHPYPFHSTERNEGGVVNVYNCKEIFIGYCASVLGQSINPAEELYDYTRFSGHGQDDLVAVRYPSPDGWKAMDQTEKSAFWGGVDTRQIFSASKGKSNAKKEELLFVYFVVVKLRESRLLDPHNKPSQEAQSLQTKQNCPLRSSLLSDSIALKQKASFTDDGRDIATMLTNAPSLEDHPGILLKYVQFVFDSPIINFKDHLFDYCHDTKLMPSALNFPTPGGWEKITERYYRMEFELQDLDEQLDPGKPRTDRKKAELGMISLAVSKIHELGYLDDAYEPCLQPAALLATRKNCKKNDHAAPPTSSIPREIDVLEDVESELSGEPDHVRTSGETDGVRTSEEACDVRMSEATDEVRKSVKRLRM